jgi:hypothetical protein
MFGTSAARAVYRGMKTIALTLAAALLALPALAQAKTGVEFEGYPDTAKPGEKINFTVMVFPDGPSTGAPSRFEGRHPLVTFRSKSGRTVRVRATAADLNGISHGQVAFPDKGPWTTEMKVGNVIESAAENSEPIRVGAGLTQTIPAPGTRAPRTAAPEPDSFPWVWVLSIGSIGSALLVVAMRRRGRWGAA